MVQNKGMEKNALVSYLTSIFRSPAWDADHFIIYGFVLFSLALFAWWVIGNLRHSLCSDCLTIGNNGDSGKKVGISTLEVFYLYFRKIYLRRALEMTSTDRSIAPVFNSPYARQRTHDTSESFASRPLGA